MTHDTTHPHATESAASVAPVERRVMDLCVLLANCVARK